jgi:hypothetical protein
MPTTQPPVPAPICPFIGLQHDASTSHTYASAGNYCYHSQEHRVPLLEHQARCCLASAYPTCPLYPQPLPQPFPSELTLLLPEPPHRRLRQALKWLVFFGGLSALSLGWYLFQALPTALIPIAAHAQAPAASTPAPTLTTLALILPVLPSPTTSPRLPRLTATLAPPPPHTLETRLRVGSQVFLIHLVRLDENYEILSRDYKTTRAVIQALNDTLHTTLWVDAPIVIAPGAQSPDPNWPVFQAWQVPQPDMTIDQVAALLKADPDALRYYNACPQACPLTPGDWLLIPTFTD